VKRWVLLAVGVCLAAVVTRVFWDGHAALARGDEALKNGDAALAMTEWRRAARWYAPGAPHVADAYDRLEVLARTAEDKGDAKTALDAWRAVRSSILATRSFYTPFPDRLARADERIAALMAKVDTATGTEEERRQFHYELLRRDDSPRVGWALVALLGFGAWVGGGFWFARRGVGEDGRLERRAAARAGLLIAAGILVWMLGLYQA
jgi:hypothetical protein